MSDLPAPGRSAFRFFLLLTLCLGLPLWLVSLDTRAPTVNLYWDWANALGFLALAAGLLLFVYRGRPQAFPAFSGRFFANIHRDLGYVALVLVLVHTGVLLYAEPLLLEHLKPTAPLHMLAGVVAALLMLVLVLSSVATVRRRLWRDHRSFRAVHAGLSLAALVLLLVHVVASGYYLNVSWKGALLLVAAVVVLGLYLDRRYIRPRRERRVQRQRDTSRFAHGLVYGSVALVSLLSLGLLWFATAGA